MPQPGTPILTDGSLDASAGVNSLVDRTVASPTNPNGLPRNALAWLVNGTVRDGGITQRAGWTNLFKFTAAANAAQILAGNTLYQGGWMYQPDIGDPYLVFAVGGHIFKADIDLQTITDLSQQFNLYHPPNSPLLYFCQGEEFLVIQAGDYQTANPPTLPLFWDGSILRRSNGLASFIGVPVPGVPAVPCTPVAANSFTVTNLSDSHGGSTIPAFAPQVNGPGGFQYKGLNSFVVPQIGGQVVVTATSVTLGSALPFIAPFIISPGIVAQLQISGCAPGTGTPAIPPTTIFPNVSVPEIPPAGPMEYYMGRLWWANGRTVNAGDIVDGTSGTAAYDFRDSILHVTENPLVVGGDGFTIPTTSGNITAVKASTNINSILGQGQLYIFTIKSVYALSVPVTRAAWIGADPNNQPLMTMIQNNNGAVGDRSIVPVNGDLFFHSLEPSIRSLVTAVRNFTQWGNVVISANEKRLLDASDRSLFAYATGIQFDNRLLMSALPKQTARGVIHQAIAPLDFTPVSSLGANSSPVWEGALGGLDILQMFTGVFSGVERAFAIVVDRVDQSIVLWELTQDEMFENSDPLAVPPSQNRVQWQVEFPAFTFGTEYNWKRLVGCEFWVDRLLGTVDFQADYRTDGETCWLPWHTWSVCSSKSCLEDTPVCVLPPGYKPVVPFNGPGYRQTMSLPKPPVQCDPQMSRPSDIGTAFQVRLTVKGFCRIQAIYLHAINFDRPLYATKTC